MADRHFHRELEKIKKMILTLGAMAEERVQLAGKVIETHDRDTALRIIRTDHDIDRMEVEIEEECLKTLALYQPVATDLRFIVAVIKINNDLERIGDQAVNIAQRVNIMAEKPPLADFVFDYNPMVEKVEEMLKKSLNSLVDRDMELALEVCGADDEVDGIKNAAYDRIKKSIRVHPENVGYLINMFLISRHLERLADHTTNIAEEVIYMIEGEIVRHGKRLAISEES